MDMKDKVLAWFGTGRTGASSEAMALAVCGVPGDDAHPYDPDDFNRCLLFLGAVPEARNHMDRIAALSPTWRRIVSQWGEIEACFLGEVGLDWSKARSAPKTYDLMQKVIYAD